MAAVMIMMTAVMAMIHRVCRFWLRRTNSCARYCARKMASSLFADDGGGLHMRRVGSLLLAMTITGRGTDVASATISVTVKLYCNSPACVTRWA